MTLAAENISVTLGGKAVLSDVSAVFQPGRITALLGPNGAGKSTLLACLAGLRWPQSGQATLDGIVVGKLSSRERARTIGLLPQEAEVHWNVDVATLIGLGRYPHRSGWGQGPEDRAAIDRAMAATDTAAFKDRTVSELSGGERARVLLARVLAGEPRWLLADEPLASLDPAHQLEVVAALRNVADAGAGVVMVLHDLSLAARLADDVLLLSSGHTVAFGPRERVLTEPLLAEAYGVAVEIGYTAGGLPFLVTSRRL
jgi:iron complex transport system ATP-binding protein